MPLNFLIYIDFLAAITSLFISPCHPGATAYFSIRGSQKNLYLFFLDTTSSLTRLRREKPECQSCYSGSHRKFSTREMKFQEQASFKICSHILAIAFEINIFHYLYKWGWNAG